MFRNSRYSLLLLALFFGPLADAHAVPLTFTLQGVTFEDGAAATGSFQFAGSWDITVGEGEDFSEFRYTPSTSHVLPVQGIEGLTFFLGALHTRRALRLVFPDPVGVLKPGDVLPLILTDSATLIGSRETGEVDDVRRFIRGSVLLSCATVACEPVPEVSTFAFLGLGLLVVGARLLHTKRNR